MNQKIIAVFLIFVIVSITPASAVEYADIQNDIDSIRYSQQHFGFWQSFKVMGKVFKLMEHVCQIDVYSIIDQSRGMREQVKNENRNKQLERTTLLNYLRDKDRIENPKQIKTLNTKTSIQDFKQINKINQRITETKRINTTEKTIKDSNQVNNTQNLTKSSNQIQNIGNDTQINGTDNNQAETVEAPEKAVEDANNMKSKLKEKGLNVKIRNSHSYSINELKSKDIVQLVETNHGYIRYLVFKGINKNATDNKVVSLYNGKNDVNLSLKIFKRAFTGIIMNLDGDYKIKIINTWWGQRYKIYISANDSKRLKDIESLNNNFFGKYGLFMLYAKKNVSSNKVREKSENDEVTEYDVVDEIFQIQKNTLKDSQYDSGKKKTIAGLLKGIGIGLTIIASIITGLAAVFVGMPEPIISKLAAAVIGIISVIVFVLAATVFFYGLGWETDILLKESSVNNELANLESGEL